MEELLEKIEILESRVKALEERIVVLNEKTRGLSRVGGDNNPYDAGVNRRMWQSYRNRVLKR